MRAHSAAPGELGGNRGGRIKQGNANTIPRYRPPGTGAAICRGCNLIFRPKLAHHVVCPRCNRDDRRAREVRA